MNETGTSGGEPEGTDRLPTPGRGGGLPGRDRWRLAAAIAAVIALVAVLVVVLVGRDGDDKTTTAQGRTTSTTTTSEATTTTTAAPTTQPASPSEADTLEDFFSAAATMDQQLHAAATAINGIGPPWPSVSEQVASTVSAAELEPVTGTIPAGLPHDLLQSVILVYSDLTSRRAAMESFAHAHPPDEPQYRDLLEELGNGHTAAERFDADLTEARALAAAQPPVTAATPDSRATAELLVLFDYVHKANFGCDSRGGAVITHLPTITWQTDTGGTIGEHGMTFEATLGPDGHWAAYIIAC